MRLGALTITFSILGCAPALQPAPQSTQTALADAQQLMMLVTQARLEAQSNCLAQVQQVKSSFSLALRKRGEGRGEGPLRKGELNDFATGTAKPDLKTVFAPLTP